MDLGTGALLLTGAFNLVLVVILLIHAPRTPANVCYALLVLCLVAWTIAIIALRLAAEPRLQFLALAESYTAGLGIVLSFWYFSAFFTGRRLPTSLQIAALGGAVAVGWLIWTSPTFIQATSRTASGALSISLGRAGWVFVAYFVLVMADAFRSLALRYRVTAGAERHQVLSILIGTLLSTLLGVTFNVILVQAGTASYIAWGPVSTIIMVAFIAFAIVRHHLMSIHLVTAELFTFGLILSLIVNLLVSPDPVSRLVEAVTLQLAIGFGAYLIKAALRDADGRAATRRDDVRGHRLPRQPSHATEEA